MPSQSQSPTLLDGFSEWAKERFPAEHVISAFLTYFFMMLSTRALTSAGPVSVYPADLLGGLAVTCHFLFLRILDEHKDFEVDRINHPQRALQRGLITLGHLKALGALTVVTEAWITLALAPSPEKGLVAWIVMMGWTLLMAKEFFAGEWLKQRLTLYSVSHMLVMPLVAWWMATLSVPSIGFSALIPFLVMNFVSGMVFEITRKTRAPEEEKDTIDSYSKVLGRKGSLIAIAVFCLIVFVTQLFLVSALTPGGLAFPMGVAIAALGLGTSLLSLLRFHKKPDAKARKRNELTVGLFMLANYVFLITGVIVGRGIHWGMR